ncbi:Alpha/Beta hydrolase protein [Nemania sp. FL0916]|nr:Alpha/Beta hydrolase protein [Nemania sp. FL0916]
MFRSRCRSPVDYMISELNDVVTSIDQDSSPGRSGILRGGWGWRMRNDGQDESSRPATTSLAVKVDLYANSRLPHDLPTFEVSRKVFTLLCLAAQYSEKVYKKPSGAERDAHVNSNWRAGTKAMFIKLVSLNNTIVVAIRGTATVMDWAVNFNTAPTSATGFLDDVGNHCHAGFLSVAKQMIPTVASSLRQLLRENPNRSSCSLIITGHSAGGAVASLLYMHMLATSGATLSELNTLTTYFKRIHCITFGAPPVSLLPLKTPRKDERKGSLFYSFINEGDPVTRAEPAYLKNLLELYYAPAPAPVPTPTDTPSSNRHRLQRRDRSSHSHSHSHTRSRHTPGKPVWPVATNTLSNAGRIVVLRPTEPHIVNGVRTKTVEERLGEGVIRAQVASDEKLRRVIWGDTLCHHMKLYAARIETLALLAK